MSTVRRISEAYGGFIADHPWIMTLATFAVVLLAIYGNSLLKTVSMNQKDMLPKNDMVVKDLNYLEDEFGGTETALIVVELDQTQTGSNGIKDVRDPRVIEYVDILAQKAKNLEDVVSTASSADLIRTEDRLSKSENTIRTALENNPVAARYTSSDFSMTLVRLNLVDKFDEDKLYRELGGLIDETPHPPGVTAKPSGSVVVGASIKSQIGPDMAKTGQLSGLMVLTLVLITFWSVRYGLISLLAIIVGGSLWSFGLMGFIGMSITSQTSAGLSMILGIGIDFGIQVVSRFRIETAKYGLRRGMVETMNAVLVPMSTTTLAALIGFRAMSLGELTILRDLATMMSVGVLCSMIAAITIVPSALVLAEKIFKEYKP